MTPQEWVLVLVVSLGILLMLSSRVTGARIDRLLERIIKHFKSNL